jgi:hypothetical protein
VKTGYALRPWQEAISDADPDALKALYWLMMEQNGIRINYDRLNFNIVKFYGAFADASEAEREAAEAKAKEDAEAAKANPTTAG